MESHDVQADAVDPRAELRAAEAARERMVQSVSYPHGYVASSAMQAALLMIGAGSAADAAPSAAVRAVLIGALAASIALAGINLNRFERHNGARISGFRFGRAGMVLYVVVLALVALIVSNRANVVGWWWAGFIAAPFAAAGTVLYLRYWLATYRSRA